MLKIGITGQKGFIGTHLYNTISLFKDEFQLVDFHKDFFYDAHLLDQFVSQCDVIVQLAAMNRHSDPNLIYDTNIDLVQKLADSLTRTKSTAHVLFSSSVQEERDNVYGRSKREGREILANWAKINNGKFTGLVIPNVFGPFGRPSYNSVIATFCHQLTHNETPKIDIDGELKLIYVGELVESILACIRKAEHIDSLTVAYTSVNKVSEILSMLEEYKLCYLDQGIIPQLKSTFETNLFNAFRSYIDLENHYPVKFEERRDGRGSFVEIIRLHTGGQVSFSTTLPQITRGNHFHTRKIERFAVIKGKALIQIRRVGTEKIISFHLSGDAPAYIDMPIWYVHNIKNIGEDELFTLFWINEFFNPSDSDTYLETV